MESRIWELRKRLGLRQEDLAREPGVTRQTIHAIKNNRYAPALALVMRLPRCRKCRRRNCSLFRNPFCSPRGSAEIPGLERMPEAVPEESSPGSLLLSVLLVYNPGNVTNYR